MCAKKSVSCVRFRPEVQVRLLVIDSSFGVPVPLAVPAHVHTHWQCAHWQCGPGSAKPSSSNRHARISVLLIYAVLIYSSMQYCSTGLLSARRSAQYSSTALLF
eukprot:591387-Rhodomonas_salina.3